MTLSKKMHAFLLRKSSEEIDTIRRNMEGRVIKDSSMDANITEDTALITQIVLTPAVPALTVRAQHLRTQTPDRLVRQITTIKGRTNVKVENTTRKKVEEGVRIKNLIKEDTGTRSSRLLLLQMTLNNRFSSFNKLNSRLQWWM